LIHFYKRWKMSKHISKKNLYYTLAIIIGLFFISHILGIFSTNKSIQVNDVENLEMSGEKRFFEGDEHVKLYVTSRPSVPLKIVTKITEYLKENRPEPFGLAVDVACGSGQSTLVLAEGGQFDKVVGVDVSPGQIREANERPDKPENVQFMESPAEKLPFEDKSVDVIYVNMAIHWFNREAFFPEVRRVLKEGGVLAISMFTNAGEESPLDLEDDQKKRFDDAQSNFTKEVLPFFDKGISLYMEEYKPIHPLPGFTNSLYITGPDLTFQRKVTSKLQYLNLLTTSGYQLMKKANPTLADKIADDLRKEMEASVGDMEKEINFEHSMILLLGTNP